MKINKKIKKLQFEPCNCFSISTASIEMLLCSVPPHYPYQGKTQLYDSRNHTNPSSHHPLPSPKKQQPYSSRFLVRACGGKRKKMGRGNPGPGRACPPPPPGVRRSRLSCMRSCRCLPTYVPGHTCVPKLDQCFPEVIAVECCRVVAVWWWWCGGGVAATDLPS